jgi:hypothetical protein
MKDLRAEHYMVAVKKIRLKLRVFNKIFLMLDQEIEFQEIESFYKILHNCSGDRIGPRGSFFQDFFSYITLPYLT